MAVHRNPILITMIHTDLKAYMYLLEFTDSAFPVGSFSFSNGLETAVFEKIVYNAETLEEYTRTVLQQIIHCDAIAALQAFRASANQDYERIRYADQQIMLCKMNAENRLMLTRMGKKMAEICIQLHATPLLKQWLKDIHEQKTAGTYPITQAIWFQGNGVSEPLLFAAIEYGTINLILNAALRCVKVSHYETQSILYRLCSETPSHYEQIRTWNFEDMQTFAPEMDIIASLHEKGKMRMFMN